MNQLISSVNPKFGYRAHTLSLQELILNQFNPVQPTACYFIEYLF